MLYLIYIIITDFFRLVNPPLKNIIKTMCQFTPNYHLFLVVNTLIFPSVYFSIHAYPKGGGGSGSIPLKSDNFLTNSINFAGKNKKHVTTCDFLYVKALYLLVFFLLQQVLVYQLPLFHVKHYLFYKKTIPIKKVCIKYTLLVLFLFRSFFAIY